MDITFDQREKLELRLEEKWALSKRLFGDVGCYVNDFEHYNYTYFLDNVKSLEELLDGLRQLSLLADEALEVANGMGQQDFYDFKIALKYERWRASSEEEESKIPERYVPILLPVQFLRASFLVEEYQVPLGAALIRLIDYEECF